MTGDKPDERLRTPMQWSRTSAGFTTGTPWETAQADSLTINVDGEMRETGSLLSYYRRLLQERAKHSALRDGDLEPVETGSDAVLAYIRRDSTDAVLVAVNLGTTSYVLRRPRVSGAEIPGRLAPRHAYLFNLVLGPQPARPQ
jgi:glycosidase